MTRAKPNKTRPRGRWFDPGIFLVSVLCLAPIAGTVAWTFFPSFASLAAMVKLSSTPLQVSQHASSEDILTVKRQIQRHFLEYSVYIPTEDIVLFEDAEQKNSRLETLMTKACGRSNLYVWVPFKFALPFYGEKVIEWCWKPKLQTLK